MEIRQFRASDFERVRRLWSHCGLTPSAGDSLENLTTLIYPELFVVVAQDDRLVGSLMATFDGRRGWLHHLAVDHAYRHRGIATDLVHVVEQRLRTLGCQKINLLIEPENAVVQKFYESCAYRRDELVFMEKWLTEE